MKITITKAANGLHLADEESTEALAKVKVGTALVCNVTQPRNYNFHKKYFALLDYAFDIWQPEEKTYKDQVIQKNKERFRKDIQIMAGYYEACVNIKNEVRLESKSISFGSMEQDEFEKLYQSVITVLIDKVLIGYDRKELDNVVNHLLTRFA
ncbi:MAG: DUF1367 family protein [Candidatus Shapirobacteria bacterium]